jgi:hypothetical protein
MLGFSLMIVSNRCIESICRVAAGTVKNLCNVMS